MTGDVEFIDLEDEPGSEEIPDEPDEEEGEEWVLEKDVTPDMSADDPVPLDTKEEEETP